MRRVVSDPVQDQTVGWGSVLTPVSLLSAHEAGLVCLQVLESGGSLSSSVLFEYRARNASSLPSSQLDWLSLDGQSRSATTTLHSANQRAAFLLTACF